MSGWRLKAFAAVALGIAIIVTLPHYLEPPKYDQHAAIMFGIAAANYKLNAARDLFEYSAKKTYPDNPDWQRRYIEDATAGWRAEQRFQK